MKISLAIVVDISFGVFGKCSLVLVILENVFFFL